jgi:hypothetical protein
VQKAIRAGLRARPGLAGCTVSSAWTPDEIRGQHYLVVGMEIDGSQRYPAASIRYKEDRFSIHCEASTYQPGVGDDEIDDALDRLIAWWGEVESYLRETPQITPGLAAKVLLAETGGYNIDQGYDVDGRVVVMTFDIDVHTRLISQ